MGTFLKSSGNLIPVAIFEKKTGAIGRIDLSYKVEQGIVVDPVLANNDWATIKSVCEAGDAGNYWSVGDIKNVTGGDTYTRPVMIVDMQGLYNKHVVFQFRYKTENNYVWASNGVNDYENATVRTTINSGGNAYSDLFSSDLGSILTDTTVKVCKGGTNATLVDITNKVFLPAEKEVSTSPIYSRTEEQSALITFQYYATHTSNDDRKIPKPSAVGETSGNSWWLRSPRSGYTGYVCVVYSSGSIDYDGADGTSYGVSVCFAF